MEANGYRNVLSLKMFGLGLPMMLKEYGMNYEKRHTKQGIQTNLSLKEESYGDWLPKCDEPTATNLLRPATAGLCILFSSRVNNPLFTLHRMFTLYHYENINKTKGEQCEQLNPKKLFTPSSPSYCGDGRRKQARNALR
jgi:hypothetical protein